MTGRALVAGLALLALAGCDSSGGWLSGSLSSVYDTRFVDVQARLYESELAIEYRRGDGSTPVRVTVSRRRLTLEDDITALIEQREADVSGIERDGTAILPPSEGDVELQRVDLFEGGRVKGRFGAVFPASDRELGLVGGFDTRVEVVDWETVRP